MSKFDEAFDAYKAELKELNVDVNDKLLKEITKSLGPSIYLKDASLVSCSDQSELDRIKTNFLVRRLEMTNDEEIVNALKEVCSFYNVNQKKRAVFYYLLVTKLKKESFFNI